MKHYKPAGKLKGLKAVITGGDSGIGRAVAIGFAKEGADVAIVFLEENEDAQATCQAVKAEKVNCLSFRGDVGDVQTCENVIEKAAAEFGQIDILVNNAAQQYPVEQFEDITVEQLHKTFATNIFAYFYMTKAALKYMPEGGRIINTTSVTAYEGHKTLIDYSATKGAITAFTRSLSLNLSDRRIRVNAVAPGPIWTPLIPSSFNAEKVDAFGSATPMKRPGQPDEIAPCYIFLAGDDSSYMSGQVLHPNGGRIVNG